MESTDTTADMAEAGVWDCLATKTTALQLIVNTAVDILRLEAVPDRPDPPSGVPSCPVHLPGHHQVRAPGGVVSLCQTQGCLTDELCYFFSFAPSAGT